MKKQVKNELLWVCGLSALALFASKYKKASLVPMAAGGLLLIKKTAFKSLRGHSVVITGGSRGLGLAIADELVQEYSNVTLLARDYAELARASDVLEQHQKGSIHIIECDVTNPDELKTAFEDVQRRFGGIDMLINNAGAITVGPWETMEQADFEAQMDLHVYAPMNATRLVLPYLRAKDSGKRIVNICSMGGKVAVPHMLPYDTSKFALAGFSQGVGAELEHEGISVTTIYPTLMRTGSPIQAVFKGDHEKEFAWFQAGDVMPGLSTSAHVAARAIVKAAKERRWELIPSFAAKARMTINSFFPELMAQTMAWMNRLLPKGKSKEYKTGAQSRGLFEKSILTKALVKRAHEAEDDLNQEAKTDAHFNMSLH